MTARIPLEFQDPWYQDISDYLNAAHAPDGTPRYYDVRPFEYFGGAQNQPVAQQQTAWTQYLNWAKSNGGGVCGFGPYRYMHLPSMIDIPSYGGVHGTNWATVLEIDASATGHGVATHISTDGAADPNAVACSFRSFWIDFTKVAPGNVNGSGMRTVAGTQDGLHIETNPTSGPGGTSDERFGFNNDTESVIQEVFVHCAPQDGISMIGKGEINIVNCRVYSVGRHGFSSTYDSNYLGCTSGGSGSNGFYINAGSVRLVGCKAWYSGNTVGSVALGAGFYILGNSNACVNLVGCEGQDNRGSAYSVDTCNGPVHIVGCSADSNSRTAQGTSPALDIWNSSHGVYDIVCSERVSAAPTQMNALRIRSISNNNKITLTHKALNSATVGVPINTGSDFSLARTNDISINGYGGRQTPAYVATYTPDPTLGNDITITLTGAITIAAPVAGTFWPGCTLRFNLIQDATGGRAVTWNTVYKGAPVVTTTLSTRTAAEFTYDGTNWISTAVGTALTY
jgi:hypothetical protein